MMKSQVPGLLVLGLLVLVWRCKEFSPLIPDNHFGQGLESLKKVVHHTVPCVRLWLNQLPNICGDFFFCCLSVVGLRPSSLLSAGCVVSLRGDIEPFSATLAQDGLAECDQPRKNPLKYSAVAGN